MIFFISSFSFFLKLTSIQTLETRKTLVWYFQEISSWNISGVPSSVSAYVSKTRCRVSSTLQCSKVLRTRETRATEVLYIVICWVSTCSNHKHLLKLWRRNMGTTHVIKIKLICILPTYCKASLRTLGYWKSQHKSVSLLLR